MSLATNAALYRSVAKLLTSWGWPVEYAAGWETRTNGSVIRTPSAVTVHHTGGKATATSYLLNPRDRPQLKVLANVHITHDRRIKTLAAGSTSHGGYTHEACYQRVVQGTAPLDRDLIPGADSLTFSINTRTVGIEVDGAGGADEWDDWTIRAVVAVSAAWQIVTGWMADGKAPRVGAHKEHTKRKPGDPYMSMGDLRTRVAAVVASGKPYGPTEAPVIPPSTTEPGEATDPEPTPEPEPTPAGIDFRFGLAAMQASQWGGPKAGTSKRGDYLRGKLACSVYAVTEMPEVDRDATRQALGGMNRWLTFPVGYVAVLFDSTKWKHAGSESVTFGTPYHGAVRAQLVGGNGQALDVIAFHVRPTAAFPNSASAGKVADAKAGDVQRAVKLARDRVPTIIAGDFNRGATDALTKAGFTRATAAVDTLDGPGTQVLDQVWVRGLPVRYATLVESPVSDHDSWRVGATLPAPSAGL